MHRILIKLPLLLLLSGLAACAAKMETDVTRFHQLPAPAGERIEVQPANPANGNSPAFNQYADMVGAKLGAFGYKPPVKGQPSDMVALIDYGVGPGPGGLREGHSPVSLGFGMGVGSHHSSFGLGMATEMGGHSSAASGYTCWFTLFINQAAGGKRLFEGRAVSSCQDGNLVWAMPYMINAMFTDFPGQNGVVKKVTVDIPPAGQNTGRK